MIGAVPLAAVIGLQAALDTKYEAGDAAQFASVRVDGDITFGTNNAYDVGKTDARARNGWFGGTVIANDLSVVTTGSFGGNVTVGTGAAVTNPLLKLRDSVGTAAGVDIGLNYNQSGNRQAFMRGTGETGGQLAFMFSGGNPLIYGLTADGSGGQNIALGTATSWVLPGSTGTTQLGTSSIPWGPIHSNRIMADSGTRLLPSHSFRTQGATGMFLNISPFYLGLSVNETEALKLSTTTAEFAGLVYAPNGYVTTPSYSFANDTNTGWYSYSADVMAAAAGGKIAAQVDYNGSSNYCEAGTNLRAYNLLASNAVIPAANIYWGSVSDYAPRLWGGLFDGRYTLSPWDMSATYYTQQNGHQIIGNRFTSGYHYGGNSTGFSPFINVDSHLMLAAGIPIRFSGSSTDVYNSGAADLKLVRSGTKTLTLDDNAGGNATLKVVGSFLMQPSPAVAGYAAFYATNFGHAPVGLFPSGQNGNNTGIAWYNASGSQSWELFMDKTGTTDTNLELRRFGASTPLLNFPSAGTSMQVNGSITTSNGATFKGSSYPAGFVAVEPYQYAFHSSSAGPCLKVSDYSGLNVYGWSVANDGTMRLGPSSSNAAMYMNGAQVFLSAVNGVHFLSNAYASHLKVYNNAGNTYDIGENSYRFRDGYFAGTLYAGPVSAGGLVSSNVDFENTLAGGGLILKSPDGTIRKRLYLDNSGALTLSAAL